MADLLKSVRGMRDILPDETRVWQSTERLIFEILEEFGFEEIRIPIVEQFSLFQRSVGSFTDIVQKEMYVFKDKADRILALRPEATAGVVRAYLEHQLYMRKKITRLYYSGPMFRYDRPQKGRYRQFYQVGAEIFGGESPYFDAELIIILGNILQRLDIKKYIFEINSVGCDRCKVEYTGRLQQFLSPHKDGLCHDCKLRLQNNVLRVLDCKVASCRRILEDVPSIQKILCSDCKKHQEILYRTLEKIGIEFVENKNLVRGLDYYTMTVFELKINNEENAVAGGGRYDNLVADLGGPKTFAAGFAIGMDRLCNSVIPKLENKMSIFVFFLGQKALQDGITLVNQARNNEIRIIADYTERSLKNHLKIADKEGAEHVLILGEDELSQQVFLYKNMKDGSQRKIRFEHLSNFLKGLRNA
ncbi:MAG: histidine--tRNA ligase [Candidatus Omnitrophica bacterium]|nr:histidine--tRNA ligase [Candidatus Omnitrophota bacterium]MCM8816612.1 histidine--tRNA ligase [Candidatus Omnitrophota bacterium]